jgi:hypothetical protein
MMEHAEEPATVLTEVLEWLEEHLDSDHAARVEERHRRAMGWKPVDRLPVVIAAPAASRFPCYPYSEAFRDPVKMLVNELVDASTGLGPIASPVNSALLKDDFPLQIRPNFGAVIVASLFGSETRVVEDNFPWSVPIGPQRLAQTLDRGLPDLRGGHYPQVVETIAYYHEALAPYPKCSAAIHITQPDFQGPLDIATQLWGSEIFVGLYDDPSFVREILDLVAETYIALCQDISRYTTQSAGDGFIYLHWSICKGGCIIKDDSSVMLSPKTYAEFVRPSNEKILEAMGGGGIHWCGSGDQWRERFVETQALTAVDIGQPAMIDLTAWAKSLSEHRVAVSSMNFDADTFRASNVTQIFPTGAAVTVIVDSLDQGRRILHQLEPHA